MLNGRIHYPIMPTKRKVSVTVEAELLEEVDRLAGSLSRSTVFEQALMIWLRRQRQVSLDQATERYYRSLGKSEQAEDAEWAALGDETVRERWKDSDE
jgi:metal-responsive CopG/Arc/MetJ family transcriptional regulator